MCFGSTPKPPDPVATAQAQSAINRADLGYAAGLNQINQTGPFGSVSYSGEIGSPNRTQTTTLTPGMQGVLDGQTQLTGGLTDLANQRLAGAPRSDFTLDGQPSVRRAGDVTFGRSFDQGPGVQTSFNNGGSLARSFNNGGDLQRGFDSGGDITRSFDAGGVAQRGVDLGGVPQLRSDFDNLVGEARNAQYGKASKFLDPQFAQEEQATRARLAAQGITEGSQAFQTEMDNFSRNKGAAYDDARNSAILSGDNLQNQLFSQSLAGRQQGVGEQFQSGQFSNDALAQQFGMNQGQAQFQNQAQNQGFGQNQARAQFANDATMQDFARNSEMARFGNEATMQDYARNMGSAQFGNDAAGQQYAQNMGAAQFGNDALAQQFNAGLNLQQADQSNRSQSINENVLGRNQNINEAMAFVNGSPISPQNPTFQPFAQSTAAQAAPDAMGLASANYGNQSAARSAILGSIFGAAGRVGGAAVAACWVAREVYGVENPKWVQFREWMLNKSPKWFRHLYLTYGERFADWVKDKPKLKTIIRKWMDARIYAAA